MIFDAENIDFMLYCIRLRSPIRSNDLSRYLGKMHTKNLPDKCGFYKYRSRDFCSGN